MGIVALCWAASPLPAAAQFGWFGGGEGSSSQDAYESISNHGFRLVGPLMQNNDVYIADVIDRRQRRQRLILSRQTGQIVQRFLVDGGGATPFTPLPGSPGAPPLPQRSARSDPDFFSRVVRGFGNDEPPRPPADIDNPERRDAVEPKLPPRSLRAAKPRPTDIDPLVAARREDAPVTSRPLAPVPAAGPAPAEASVAPAATAPEKSQTAPLAPAAPARATVVTTDPLRIPGTTDPDAGKSAGTASASTKPVAPAVAAAAVKPPLPKASPKTDVPVAPLD